MKKWKRCSVNFTYYDYLTELGLFTLIFRKKLNYKLKCNSCGAILTMNYKKGTALISQTHVKRCINLHQSIPEPESS